MEKCCTRNTNCLGCKTLLIRKVRKVLKKERKLKEFSSSGSLYIYWQGSISLSQNHGESTTYSLTLLWLPKLPSRKRVGLWVGLWGRFGSVRSNNSVMLQHPRKGFRTLNMNLSWQNALGSPPFELARPQAVTEKVIRR